MITSAYIAGFLDGEGNITILRRNQYNGYRSYGLHVGFTNLDVRPLLAIQDVYGGHLFEKKRKSTKHRQAFELRVCQKAAVEKLLKEVLPHLLIKREQAELGIAFLKLGKVKMEVIGMYRNSSVKGGLHPVSKAAAGEQEAREEMKQNLMLLNKRGA